MYWYWLEYNGCHAIRYGLAVGYSRRILLWNTLQEWFFRYSKLLVYKLRPRISCLRSNYGSRVLQYYVVLCPKLRQGYRQEFFPFQEKYPTKVVCRTLEAYRPMEEGASHSFNTDCGYLSPRKALHLVYIFVQPILYLLGFTLPMLGNRSMPYRRVTITAFGPPSLYYLNYIQSVDQW